MYYHFFSENFFTDLKLKDTVVKFEENKLIFKHKDFNLKFKTNDIFELNNWMFSFNQITINHQSGFFLQGKKNKKVIYAVSLCHFSTHYDEIIKEFDLQFPHFNLNKKFIQPEFKYHLTESETHFILKIEKNEKLCQEEITLKLKSDPKLRKTVVKLDNEMINKIKLFAQLYNF